MSKQENRLTLLDLAVDEITPEDAKAMDAVYHELHRFLIEMFLPKMTKPAPHLVVIGGGIIGIMLAYYASRLGLAVSVVERSGFGLGASGRNGGGVLTLGRTLKEVPLMRVSLDLWESLADSGIQTHFVRSGHLMVARNELEVKRLAQAQKLYQAAGLTTQLLDNPQLLQLIPDLHPELKGGLYCPTDAQSYPFTTIRSLMQSLKAKGVQLIRDCMVTDFQVKNNRVVSVVTDQGAIKGDLFTICTGPWVEWVEKALGLSIPITPRRSQIMVTEIFEKRRVNPFVSGNQLYLRQTHAGNLLYGGGGPWEESGFQIHNTMFAITHLAQRLVELFPSYQTKQLIRAFAGTVEITPDHLPIVGQIPGLENLYLSAGYHGHGYGISAVMGKLVAQILSSHATDRPVIPPAIESFIRSFDLQRFGTKN